MLRARTWIARVKEGRRIRSEAAAAVAAAAEGRRIRSEAAAAVAAAAAEGGFGCLKGEGLYKSFRGEQCNMNGISADSVVPHIRDTTLPPILHLILGLVNAIKEPMHAMLECPPAGLGLRGPGGARPPRLATTAAAAAVFVQLTLR